MKKLLLTILITISITTPIFAEDISVDDLLGNNQEEVSQNVDEEETERTENIENELNISIPDYTDNPSHIITFRDPSEDSVGVELDIDESGYKDINSPYSLPSLSIGSHHLKYRFVDSIGATKVLEYDLVIIPRPPILKAPTFQENDLVLSGTGLARSEIIVTISVGASNYTQIADIDSEGNWTTSVTLDTIPSGIYTVFGTTRKDGYASNPSEPAVIERGDKGVVENPKGNSGISFAFSELDITDIPNIIVQNPDLLITIISTLLLGILLTSLFFIIFKREKQKELEKDISKKINGKEKKEKTLMEMFGEKDVKENKKKQKVKKEKKNIKIRKKKGSKKEKTFTKKDFLKDFKKFDPDKDSGKEKKEPKRKDKKDIIVTLTSKVKE